jgi:hypothetical protein
MDGQRCNTPGVTSLLSTRLRPKRNQQNKFSGFKILVTREMIPNLMWLTSVVREKLYECCKLVYFRWKYANVILIRKIE